MKIIPSRQTRQGNRNVKKTMPSRRMRQSEGKVEEDYAKDVAEAGHSEK